MDFFSKPAVVSILIFSAIVGFGFSVPEFAVHKDQTVDQSIDQQIPTTTLDEVPAGSVEASTTTTMAEVQNVEASEELFEGGACLGCERRSPLGIYNPEPVAQCGQNRRFLAPGFAQVPASVKENRSDSFKIPKACVSHIARSFAGDARATNDFGQCGGPKGRERFKMGGVPACISETYVNTVFNSLVDVFDCFDLDAKLYFPIFAQAGGLNINSVSRNDLGTGVGQLLPIAVADVNTSAFDIAKQHILQNRNKKSCERLSSQIRQLTKVKLSPRSTRWEDDSERCKLMDLPEAPVLNFFYVAAQSIREKAVIQKLMEGRTNNLMGQAKLKLDDLQTKKLIEVLRLLSRKVGTGKAVSLFNSFLVAKVKFGQPTALSDLDLFKEPRPQDPSFRDSELSFYEYLIRYGHKELLLYVNKSKELNQIFPEGVCALNSYSLE